MSRIGKKPIIIPPNVDVSIENSKVTVRGPLGILNNEFQDVNIQKDGNKVIVSPNGKGKKYIAIWGLTRSLINNMIIGVTQGYRKELQIVGTGYRVEKDKDDIVLSLGFSHPVKISPPPGIKFIVKDANNFSVEGIDKQLVGQIAANIRAIKKPEPYKGKGIRYKDEVVRKKAGKSGKK